MPHVTDARPLIQEAYRGGYALPAFNFYSLEMAKGCGQAAEKAGVPVILQPYPEVTT